jgi:hypothetical protein
MANQTIKTEYISPTGRQVALRIKATSAKGRITITWQDGWAGKRAHKEAALALANRLHWSGGWKQIARPEGGGFIFLREG